jgi:pretoxin HINT domain-containing protein
VPNLGHYRTKFLRAIGSQEQAKFGTMLTQLNTLQQTAWTPVDAAGHAYLAVPDDHLQAVQNDIEQSLRTQPGNYANLVDAMLRQTAITIQRPGQSNIVINNWNDLQVARANGTITAAEFTTQIDALSTRAKTHVIGSGMTTIQIARLENFRMATQGLPAAEFNARFPPEYLEAIRLGGAGPAMYEGGIRGARTSAVIAGGFDVARMAWNQDISPEALTHLGIDVTTGYGGGFVGSSIESGVNIGTTELLSQSTGAFASAGRLGGRVFGGGLGGGIAAPLITMAAMGLDPYHSYTGIDYAAKGGRAFVSGSAAGAGGALAAAGVGALAGSEVPILGNAVGFLVGLGVYYIVDSTVGDDVERQIRLDLGEGGCVKKPAATSTPTKDPDLYPSYHGCFAGETLVRTPDGTGRRISDVEPGDELLGFDERRGAFRTVRVVANIEHLGHTCLELGFGDGKPGVRVTAEHPLHSDSGWVLAGELGVGDLLTALAEDGCLADVEVASVVQGSGATSVFELGVDGCHTYFAGDLLVHNKFI